MYAAAPRGAPTNLGPGTTTWRRPPQRADMPPDVWAGTKGAPTALVDHSARLRSQGTDFGRARGGTGWTWSSVRGGTVSARTTNPTVLCTPQPAARNPPHALHPTEGPTRKASSIPTQRCKRSHHTPSSMLRELAMAPQATLRATRRRPAERPTSAHRTAAEQSRAARAQPRRKARLRSGPRTTAARGPVRRRCCCLRRDPRPPPKVAALLPGCCRGSVEGLRPSAHRPAKANAERHF
mmetsp:Transcript_177739/g.569849  ORF Transcript_177739/g.569849 Transcript_177739/m.569849 type:complete len:238 (+) Transcript_177739:3504-4217(+)